MTQTVPSRQLDAQPERKRVYLFADAFAALVPDQTTITGAVRERMKEVLGGKGAGLAEMRARGINVPPGLTITTDCCRQYQESGSKLPDGLLDEVFAELASVEAELGRKLGDTESPLLLSVRSGAKFSMPGMMDTILNLGLNDDTVESLARETGNHRFAYDAYRRFIQMYGNVVLGIDKQVFEEILDSVKHAAGARSDAELSTPTLQTVIALYKKTVLKLSGADFPHDTTAQLEGAIEAVFRSWNNDRAIYYRNLNKIDHNLGTAVNVQAMVFGNFDDQSGTGVCFTRNPSTGDKLLYGEYLINAQGEDVVAGVRTPKKIAELQIDMPAVYESLVTTVAKLEQLYGDMQDIEFTVERGNLYLLQTRTGKRTAQAAVRVAVEMAQEGVISRREALLHVDPNSVTQILLPSFDPDRVAAAKMEGRHLATGLNASPGAAVGEIVFDPDRAEALSAEGRKVILVRVETCPDDIHGMHSAEGIVTSRGGMTSHAAVVARGMGKPCVSGCEDLKIDLNAGTLSAGGKTLRAGDVISIDGSTGQIFEGEIGTRPAQFSGDFKTLLGWADEVATLKVRTNGDTPQDARLARELGAQGVGLCRTEHMFFAEGRLLFVRLMIMATSEADREKQLQKLLPMQQEDFEGIFTEMNGLPVTIRLLDPPLHEFLPKPEELIAEVATLRFEQRAGRKKGGVAATAADLPALEAQLALVKKLSEVNPMMGLRGCRLGLIFPEIYKMQVQAIFEAAIAVSKRGIEVQPEIMIPLVAEASELKVARAQLEAVAVQVLAGHDTAIDYKFGTMIELPRACLVADEIAEDAEFFSFGTNDLTQMTFGFSRDDAEGKFLNHYLDGVAGEKGKTKIFAENPFEVLDRKGVGRLMQIAATLGRARRPAIKLGICGEHGGEPSSIAFAHELGLAYVSCSPYRVPVARLAAAQAALKKTDRGGRASQA